MALLPAGDPATWTKDDISQLIKNAVDLALYLAGVLAVIYLIIGAYQYFTAYGDETKADAGKKTVTWAIIGVVVILLSKIIIGEVWRLLTPATLNFPT